MNYLIINRKHELYEDNDNKYLPTTYLIRRLATDAGQLRFTTIIKKHHSGVFAISTFCSVIPPDNCLVAPWEIGGILNHLVLISLLKDTEVPT